MDKKIELVHGTLSDLNLIYDKIEKQFPIEERLEKQQIERLMRNGKYELYLARHSLLNLMIGYAFLYRPETPNVVWLDYMAIERGFQNEGMGTQFFKMLVENQEKENLGVFLEVECGTTREKQRRIEFYEHLGVKKLPVNYCLPTKNGSYPMNLYFLPSKNFQSISASKIKNSIQAAFEYIHSDKPHRKDVYQSFSRTIQSVQF